MSKYAVYEIFCDSAPYNVEFCGHLAGVKVGTSDKNPLDISDQRRYYERMMDEIDAVYRRQIDQLQAENAKLRELVGDIWEFGFSNSAGASSVKEWYRVRDELEQRVYEALGVDDG